jgi:hypothetical protein
MRDGLATPLAEAAHSGQLLTKGDEARITEDALAVAYRIAAALAASRGFGSARRSLRIRGTSGADDSAL